MWLVVLQRKRGERENVQMLSHGEYLSKFLTTSRYRWDEGLLAHRERFDLITVSNFVISISEKNTPFNGQPLNLHSYHNKRSSTIWQYINRKWQMIAKLIEQPYTLTSRFSLLSSSQFIGFIARICRIESAFPCTEGFTSCTFISSTKKNIPYQGCGKIWWDFFNQHMNIK